MDVQAFHDVFSFPLGGQQLGISITEHPRFLSSRMLANSMRQKSFTM
jgi:hypothetical protein